MAGDGGLGRCVILYTAMAALALACARSDGTEAALMQSGLDALYVRKDPNTSIKQFTRVLVENPNHYGATFQLAMALDKAGERDEARSVWKRVLDLAEHQGDTPTAETARKRLAEPTEDDLMKAGLEALYTQRDAGRAVRFFQRLLVCNPTHYGGHYQLAKALEAAHRPEEARSQWLEMLTLAERQRDQKLAGEIRGRLGPN